MSADLTIYALLFLCSFLNVLVLTPVSVRIAVSLGAVDYPNERKVHVRPTPRLGGIAIAASVFLSLAAGFVINPYMRSGLSALTGVIIGCGIVLGLGIYDDIRNSPPWVKLLGQIVAATVVVQSGVVFSLASNPLSQRVINYFDLGMLSAPLTVVWIVGLTNAINLTDGLDGLATGICMFAAIALFLISLQQRAGMVTYVYVIIAGATLAFLKFSRFPASVFLGDSGSMFLGFLLACLSVVGTQKTYTLTALFIPIIVFGVPVFDMVAALARRHVRHSKLFQADKEHLHHLLLLLGISQKQAVWVLYGVTILLGIIAFTFTALLDEYAAVIVLIIGLLGGFLARELRAFATERTPMERGFRYREKVRK